MKTRLSFLIIILCSFLAYSQSSYNYLEELNKMGSTPNSPEAQAFAKYGNVPVNLHVGAPNVSVPGTQLIILRQKGSNIGTSK